jgi:hypothetical protein
MKTLTVHKQIRITRKLTQRLRALAGEIELALAVAKIDRVVAQLNAAR